MKDKSSRRPGVGMIIILLLVVAFSVIWIIGAFTPALEKAEGTVIGNLFKALCYGGTWCLLCLLAVLTVYYIYRLVIVLRCKKPLSYDQIKKLAARKTKSYVRQNYNFKSCHGKPSQELKDALSRTGSWRKVNEPASTFPGYIAVYMRDKEQCVVLALEKEGIVHHIWLADEIGSNGLPVNCDLSQIEKACNSMGASSVICCYCYPERPILIEDDHVKQECYDWANEQGYNWMEFSCYEGLFSTDELYFSDCFEAPDYSISDIIDRSGISPEMDCELQKEYWRANCISNFRPPKQVIISGAVILLLLCIGVGFAVMPKEQKTEEIQLSEEFVTEPTEEIRQIQTGDTITFGKYEQNGSSEDGMEAIEWIVLETEDDEYLLISKYVLFCAAYDGAAVNMSSWQTSSLYTYLRDNFYNDAFSEDEKMQMLSVWADGKEMVSLLSADSMEGYSSDYLIGTPTVYAESQNIHVYPSGGCLWWTSSTVDANHAICVNDRGRPEKGLDVTVDNIGVRPVIRVSGIDVGAAVNIS